ncbi:hypothetical protein [uncultured Mediterranean phage uvMED]|nr:hypothetical protein [uncultured Mediterranean phage uvMED]
MTHFPSGRHYLKGPSRKWDNWTFNHTDLTLIYDNYLVFEIDLASINSSNQMVDEIFKTLNKFSNGGTVEEQYYSKVIFGLVQAFEHIFEPRWNCTDGTFSGAELAQVYADDVRFHFNLK